MLTRLGPSSGQIIETKDARDILRAPLNGDDDDVIEGLLASETRRYEDFTRRVILPVEIEERFVRFYECLPLRMAPVATVDSVKYYDADGNERSVPPQDYKLVGHGNGAAVLMRPPFPVAGHYPWPISVTYWAGPDNTDPPYVEPIDQTNIMRLVARIYDTGDPMPEDEMRATMAGRRRLV